MVSSVQIFVIDDQLHFQDKLELHVDHHHMNAHQGLLNLLKVLFELIQAIRPLAQTMSQYTLILLHLSVQISQVKTVNHPH